MMLISLLYEFVCAIVQPFFLFSFMVMGVGELLELRMIFHV